MQKSLVPNIDRKGRILRAIWGVLFLAPGVAFGLAGRPWLGGTLILIGGFALFEAARGWCAARACGIRTKY